MVPFPLSLYDLSIWTAATAIILLATSELLSPYYGRLGILVDHRRIRNAAIVVALIFFITVAYRIFEIALSEP